MTEREILAKAVLIRNITRQDGTKGKCITFKTKEFDDMEFLNNMPSSESQSESSLVRHQTLKKFHLHLSNIF